MVMHDIYIIGQWPIKSTKGFETVYKVIKERKSMFLALPGKRSHGDHKTWLDCSKTIPKARPLHKVAKGN